MARAERVGRIPNSSSRKDDRGTSVQMISLECDEKGCGFKSSPLPLEKASVLWKAHLRTHGRTP